MRKTILVAMLVAASGWTASAFAAGNDAYPNGSKAMPESSTAATPSDVKASPGTTGAMKNAGEGSFTASQKAQKQEHGN